MSIAEDVALPLGYHPQPNPPRRPHCSDEQIRRLAAQMCADEVAVWFADPEVKSDDLVDQLAEAMDHNRSNDGYQIAAYLERHGWRPDADLVEILDCCSSFSWEAERQAIKEWVKANVIEPKHAVGEIVEYHGTQCTIVAIDEDMAQYVVQTAEWLEKNPTQRGNRGGYCVAYEAVKP